VQQHDVQASVEAPQRFYDAVSDGAACILIQQAAVAA